MTSLIHGIAYFSQQLTVRDIDLVGTAVCPSIPEPCTEKSRIPAERRWTAADPGQPSCIKLKPYKQYIQAGSCFNKTANCIGQEQEEQMHCAPQCSRAGLIPNIPSCETTREIAWTLQWLVQYPPAHTYTSSCSGTGKTYSYLYIARYKVDLYINCVEDASIGLRTKTGQLLVTCLFSIPA